MFICRSILPSFLFKHKYFDPQAGMGVVRNWIKPNKSGFHVMPEWVLYNGVSVLVSWEQLQTKENNINEKKIEHIKRTFSKLFDIRMVVHLSRVFSRLFLTRHFLGFNLRCFTERYFLPVSSFSLLNGQSQLMHMRIRYHFLADLHVTRRARETESEKRIRNTQNKPCRVELVTSPNRDYGP